MLEVCAALALVPDRTNLKELIGSSGIAKSQFVGPLHRLTSVGLLVPANRSDDDRRERWFAPVPMSLWRAAQELVAR